MKIRLVRHGRHGGMENIPAGTPGEALSFEWNYDDSGDKVPVFYCFFYGYTDVHQLTLGEFESL